MSSFKCKFLLHGIDTLQCAYYLEQTIQSTLYYSRLQNIKLAISESPKKEPQPITIGNSEFFLQPYGSRSGYPFILVNEDFRIETGPNNVPNFFVTFRSQGLWRESAYAIHEKFLNWADSAGMVNYQKESLSRVDFSFDYHIPMIDFDESAFVSRSAKDSQHRENGKVQTFTFGKGDIVLRVYDKVAEIAHQSEKTWFFNLWGHEKDVWRIEWQVRKPVLKSFSIFTFEDLRKNHGEILRYLASEHDTLRIPSKDGNKSRWEMHPLWIDLQEKIGSLPPMSVLRIEGINSSLEERKMRIAISMLGNLKRYAAIICVSKGMKMIKIDDAANLIKGDMVLINDPLTWVFEVKRKIREIELGQW